MNMIRMKKGTTAILLALLLIFVNACGTNNGGGGNESQATEGQVDKGDSGKKQGDAEHIKLRIYWWGAQNRHDATQKAMDEYTKLHPNITFEAEYSGWDGYWDKMASMAAGRNLPDIIQMDSFYLADYASKGQLAELSDVPVSDIAPALLDTGKYGDGLYAVPLARNALAFAYNKKTLENAGVELPQDGWTWDDVRRIGMEVKEKMGDDKYIIQDFTHLYLNYEIYQLSRGKGHPITLEGEFNFDKDSYLEYAHMFSDFRKEGIVPPADISMTYKEFDPKFDLLINGTAMSRYAYAVQLPTFENLIADSVDLVTHPKEEENAGWLKPSMFWSVSANSKHLDESKAFIDWFVNDVQANEILLPGGRGAPASNKILKALDDQFSAVDHRANEMIEIVAKDPAPFNPGASGWANFRDKDFREIGEKLMFDRITPEQAWEEIVAKASEYQ